MHKDQIISDTYLSVIMRQKVDIERKRGGDVIDFTVGDPDIKPPSFLLDSLAKEIVDVENHRYPTNESKGILEYRKAISKMYMKRYGVQLNLNDQVLSLIGSKEGAHYLCLSLVHPGDIVIVCEPAYMTYMFSAQISGAQVYSVELNEDNGYLPRLESIPENILKNTRIFFINYPHNPTGAVASLEFYEKLVRLAQKYEFIICNDNAYGEIYYHGKKTYSLLQVSGADNVAVEMNSLSKTFNVCGWRIGMLVGNSAVIDKVLKLKQYTDAGIFMPIQKTAAKALLYDGDYVDMCRQIYNERRDKLFCGLQKCGYEVFESQAGMFIWMKVPNHKSSKDFCDKLLESTGIACNPGVGFGEHGEGYVRFALNVSIERIEEAIKRLEKFN